jgi:hypothetical protein
MRHVVRLTAVATLLVLLPLTAYSQATNRAFGGAFQYSDGNGTGTLTVTPLAGDSTGSGIERVQVSLQRGGQTLNGVGAYYAPGDGAANLASLLSFALLDPAAGGSYYYQASITPQDQGFIGQGTYFLVSAPQNEFSWSLQSQNTNTETGPGVGEQPDVAAIESGQPTLVGDWVKIAAADAIGGEYFAVENQAAAPVKTATWRGGLPGSGLYRVEVFIPALQEGATPRTERATYTVSTTVAESQAVRVSQNVTTSQWVPLGTFALGAQYEVVLTDETGETAFTRSVVANAIRFIPL